MLRASQTSCSSSRPQQSRQSVRVYASISPISRKAQRAAQRQRAAELKEQQRIQQQQEERLAQAGERPSTHHADTLDCSCLRRPLAKTL